MAVATDVETGAPQRIPPSLGASAAGWYDSNQRLVLGVAGILMILVPGELVVRLGVVKEILIGSPTAIVEAFITEFERGQIWRHIWASFRVWIVGFGLASVAGILLGLVA